MTGPDTIAAIATALGPGGVAIVRVSGPGALPLADALYRTPGHVLASLPLSTRPSHQAHLGWLVDPMSGAVLDQALVLVMKGPHSFTGEDVVELQVHGGPAVPHAVLAACLRLGCRLAAPGEFTKRAFLNGRLDLAQAEAVGDLVSAKTERSLAQALGQLDGALSRQVAAARRDTIDLLARLEAAIDYPDEIEDLPQAEAIAWLERLAVTLDGFLATARQGHVWREGAALAIVGRPNVGKSSLLNALLGRERAIVTDIPGTTRDVLEEGLSLQGVPFRVLDTAGIRETADEVERLGVARTRVALAEADVVCLVVDLTTGVGPEDLAVADLVGDRPLVVAGNKLDRLESRESAAARLRPLADRGACVPLSALNGQGLDALTTSLVTAALGAEPGAVSPTTVNARHHAALLQAREAVGRALDSARADMPADFLAIDLKEAVAGLGEVTGDAIAEEVITQVFAQYCVGK